MYRSDPETLRQQLKDVLQAEEAGPLNANMRLRKKTLQQAYDQAIKQQLVRHLLNNTIFLSHISI